MTPVLNGTTTDVAGHHRRAGGRCGARHGPFDGVGEPLRGGGGREGQRGEDQEHSTNGDSGDAPTRYGGPPRMHTL